MKINPENWLETEPGDAWQVQIKQSPNSKTGLQPKNLIISATERSSLTSAVTAYQKPGATSVHLILGKNGLDLVQMVAFNRQALWEPAYNSNSVILALDYMSTLKTGEAADLQRYLVTIASNNKPKKVPLYPKEQLDGLFELAIFLHKTLGLEMVLGHAEINPDFADPGPAFPLTQFRERLFQKTNGEIGAQIVTEQVVEEVILRNSPDLNAPAVTASPLKASTPVSISEDWKDWVRVEVLQEVDGNPWLVGWLKAEKVKSGDFDPEVREGLLYTTEGRQYKFIPALEANYDAKRNLPKKDIQYIVMHITTGTTMQATVNFFRGTNPESASAHLVIGRDGRVVQMVPFNQAAHHAGGGYWENQGALNLHSIGIEVDNAGMLVEKNDGTLMCRSTIVHPSQVERFRHWKLYREKPWQTFPDIQLKVTFKVVKALARHFPSLKELLEHERINLLNRYDPGPLFPMEDLRLEILHRKQPDFQLYQTVKETVLYENSCYEPPELDYPIYPKPLPACEVELLDNDCNYWVKIKVKKCSDNSMVGRKGWVRKVDVKLLQGKYQMTRKQDFYKDLGEKHAAPSLPLGKPLLAGTPVRVQRKDNSGWSLIATPEHQIGYLFLEGWVLAENLEEVPE